MMLAPAQTSNFNLPVAFQFGQPGEYNVNLHIRIQINSFRDSGSYYSEPVEQAPNNFGMARWQIPQQYPQQYPQPYPFQYNGQSRFPHCNSGSNLSHLYYYPESSSGLEESCSSAYSNGASNEASRSWCFNTSLPNQSCSYPYEPSTDPNGHTSGRLYGNGIGGHQQGFPSSAKTLSPPTKQGCFPSGKSCNII